MSISQHRKCWT
jgi:hypothetical protein